MLLRRRIAGSEQRRRSLLLADLLNNPPQWARFGLAAESWRRECHHAVASLPRDFYVGLGGAPGRTVSVLAALRSGS
jgi:hypothetical protein